MALKPEDEYCTISEAGRLLGRSRTRVAQYLEDGRLVGISLPPRTRLITRESVLYLLDHLREESPDGDYYEEPADGS